MAQLFAALGIVFVAELGDKTQLVALGLGARHRLGPVLAGVALAYAATTFLSVVAGGLLGAALPERAIGIGGGILFLAFAGWTLRHPGEVPGEDGEDGEDGEEGEGDATAPEPAARPTAVLVASVAGAMFVAELGDKTQLATVSRTVTTSGTGAVKPVPRERTRPVIRDSRKTRSAPATSSASRSRCKGRGQAAKSVRSGSRSPRRTAGSTSTHPSPRAAASVRACGFSACAARSPRQRSRPGSRRISSR